MAETENKMNFSVGSGVIQGNLKYSEIDVDDKMDGYFINLGLGDRSGIYYFTEYKSLLKSKQVFISKTP